MHNRLEAILAARRRELDSSVDLGCGVRSASPRRDFRAAIAGSGLGVIAEIKRRSPSAGALREELDPAIVAADYEAHGAVALSVLTETTHFGGSLEDLVRARDAVALPVLRKDFILDERQLDETRQVGADAVLLIAAVLGPRLERFVQRTTALGLDALVEVHDENELTHALDAGAQIIGVNNRDLTSFEVDRATALRLRGSIPADRLCVAESGLRDAADLRELSGSGFDACLIGSALICAERPGAALAELRGVDR